VRDERSDLESLKRVLVAAPDGAQIPLAELSDISVSTAPPSIHDENGQIAGYVFVRRRRTRSRGLRRRSEAHRRRSKSSCLPDTTWNGLGSFQYLERATARLSIVVPFTLLIVFILLYVNTASITKTMIILLAVPFSAVGAIWLLWLLHYNMSIAVWVGLIALLGVDAETGVFMLLYLDLAFEERRRQGRLRSWRISARRSSRVRSNACARKVMTVGVMFMGLLPILWSQGTGADVMKRIAAPMVGGIFTSFLMELLVYPAIYSIWRGREVNRHPSAITS